MSNELVAASCAAILAVYAAGHWRTRDDARRMGGPTQERRPARSVAAVPRPAAAASLPATPGAEESAPVPDAAPAVAAVAPPPGVTAADAGASGPVVAAASAPVATPAIQPDPQPVAAVPAPVAEPPAPVPGVWHDGTYTGWGQSFHGDIEARVTIKDGEIVNVGIATCATRYPCYVIDTIILQPIDRQGPEVDRVSRATESADAYYWGLVQALEKAEIGPAAQAGRP